MVVTMIDRRSHTLQINDETFILLLTLVNTDNSKY